MQISCTREEPFWKLGWDTGYYDGHCVSSVIPSKFRDSAFKQTTRVFSTFIFNSSHSMLLKHFSWYSDS